MNSFDEILINPERGVFEATLSAAIDAVHRQLRQSPATRGAWLFAFKRLDLQALWDAMARSPTRHHEWQTRDRHWHTTNHGRVLVAWWRDYLSRRHVRLVGGCPHAGERLPTPGPNRPALACLYPANCVVATDHRRCQLLVVCGCGAWGKPGALGWMGPCCGPCFDRAADDPVPPLGWNTSGSGIIRLVISPTGERVASLNNRGQVEVRELTTGRLVVRHGSGGSQLAWTPDGSKLACDVAREREAAPLPDDIGWMSIFASPFVFHPQSQSVIFVTTNGELVLKSLSGDGPYRWFHRDTGNRLDGLAVSPDGRRLAAATMRGVLFWDTYTGQPLPSVDLLPCDGPIAFSPDGATLACGVRREVLRHVELVDLIQGRHHASLSGTHNVRDFAFTPDGSLLVSAEEDTLRVWDVRTGMERRNLSSGDGREYWNALAFTPDGRLLVLGSSDGNVRIWPAEILLEE